MENIELLLLQGNEYKPFTLSNFKEKFKLDHFWNSEVSNEENLKQIEMIVRSSVPKPDNAGDQYCVMVVKDHVELAHLFLRYIWNVDEVNAA